jgi:hypothetical protein
MPDPPPAARSLSQAIDGADSWQVTEAAREFVAKLTFATADEILATLGDVPRRGLDGPAALGPESRLPPVRACNAPTTRSRSERRPQTCCPLDPSGTRSPWASRGSRRNRSRSWFP